MKTPSQKSILVALVCTLLAIGFHAYLTQVHYDLKFGLSQEKSICNINATFNCEAVDASPYSQLFQIPIALWGMVTNGILALMILASLLTTDKRQKQWLQTAFWTASFVLLMSIIMGAITLMLVKAVCVFCLSVYVMSILTWIALYLTLDKSERLPNADSFRSYFEKSDEDLRSATVMIVLIPILTFAVHSVINAQKEKMIMGDSGLRFQADAYISEWKSNKQLDLSNVDGLAMGAAPENAKMTIVEFADFLCPHCKHAAPTLHSFAQSRPDVRFVFLSYPLDGQCNKDITTAGDGIRCDLAKAVYCARKQGKGWEAHEWAFEEYTPNKDIKTMAEPLHMDEAALDACMKSEDAAKAINAQAAAAAGEVKGTPTIFVNGRQLPAGQMRLVLEAAYEESKK